jgi:hypothetical protein
MSTTFEALGVEPGQPFAPVDMSDAFADTMHAAALNSPIGVGVGGDGGNAAHVNGISPGANGVGSAGGRARAVHDGGRACL